MYFRLVGVVAAFVASPSLDRSYFHSRFRPCSSVHAEKKPAAKKSTPHTRPSTLEKYQQRKLYLKQALSLSDAEFDKIAAKNPMFIKLRSENLAAKFSFLKDELSLNEREFKNACMREPRWFLQSKQTLEQKLQYVRERLCLSDAGLRKIFGRNPIIVSLSIKGKTGLEQKFAYLQNGLCLNEEELSRLILSDSNILTHSIQSLDKKLLYWKDRLQLEDPEALKKLALRYPTAFFSLNINENVEPKLEYLQRRLSLNDAELVSLIFRGFDMINYSIDNIGSKITCFESFLGFDETKALILRNPRIFSISAENRLKPRLEQVQELGLPIDPGVLQRMQSYTEEKWSRSIDFQTKKLLKSKGEIW